MLSPWMILATVIGKDKQVTIEGIYPGYNEPFEYPLVLDDCRSIIEILY